MWSIFIDLFYEALLWRHAAVFRPRHLKMALLFSHVVGRSHLIP